MLLEDKLGASSNINFGYFGGGDPGPYSTVDRVDFSNDTAAAVAKGPLSLARRHLGASSSRSNAIPATTLINYAAGTVATHNKGYFFGGWPR